MNRQQIAPDLEVRPVESRDAAALFAVIDRNRAHLRPWLPWVDHIRRIEDEEAFIVRSSEREKTTGAFNRAIFHRDVPVGCIGLVSIDPANRKAEIGYWLDEMHQGKGMVTLACRAMVNHVLGEMKLHRVSIHCGTENRRSRAVPERLGFWQEGIHRQASWINDRFIDLVCYAMLAPQWKS